MLQRNKKITYKSTSLQVCLKDALSFQALFPYKFNKPKNTLTPQYSCFKMNCSNTPLTLPCVHISELTAHGDIRISQHGKPQSQRWGTSLPQWPLQAPSTPVLFNLPGLCLVAGNWIELIFNEFNWLWLSQGLCWQLLLRGLIVL